MPRGIVPIGPEPSRVAWNQIWDFAPASGTLGSLTRLPLWCSTCGAIHQGAALNSPAVQRRVGGLGALTASQLQGMLILGSRSSPASQRDYFLVAAKGAHLEDSSTPSSSHCCCFGGRTTGNLGLEQSLFQACSVISRGGRKGFLFKMDFHIFSKVEVQKVVPPNFILSPPFLWQSTFEKHPRLV